MRFPQLLVEVQRLHDRLDSIDKRLANPAAAPRQMKRVLTVKETAEELGISPHGVYRLVYRDALKSSKAFKSYRFLREEIERFLSQSMLIIPFS